MDNKCLVEVCSDFFGQMFIHVYCLGDGGGPLTTYITGTITQIGIVSFGPGCLVKGTYSVYTNISSVRTWITANSGI